LPCRSRATGFHVRPSTLVARLYDAASPLDLFRANEAINAHKRRWLAQEIARLVDGEAGELDRDAVRAVRSVLVRLAEEGKVILYEQPVPPVEGRSMTGRRCSRSWWRRSPGFRR